MANQDLPSYVVPPARKPTYLNGSALVGGAAGLATGVPFAPVIGAAIGSYFGKNKMEQQQTTGKVVTPPSMLNKGAFVGGVMGALGPGLVAAGVATLAIGTGGAGLIAAAAVGAVGAFIGGKINKHFQAKEYRRAENYTMHNGPFVPPREQAQAMVQQPEPTMQPQMQPSQGVSVEQAGQQMNPQQLAQLQALATQGKNMAPPQPESMADKVGHSMPSGPQQR